MDRQDFIDQVYTCAQCGYCRFGCAVYKQKGFERYTPRGRLISYKKLLEGKLDLNKHYDELRESLYMCAGCANCDIECPTGINFAHITEFLRQDFVNKGLLPDNLNAVMENIVKFGNPYGEPRENRAQWLPKQLREPRKSSTLYFAGCTASFGVQRVPKSTAKVLLDIGYDFTVLGVDEDCCGRPLFGFGTADEAQEKVERNVEQFEKLGIKTIFTSCAGCYTTLKKHYPSNYELYHITQFFDKLVKEGVLKFEKELPVKAVYFDGCDLGRHEDVYDEPRALLNAIPGLELIELDYIREKAVCCGGPLVSSSPDLANSIAADIVQEAVDKGAKMLITPCVACFLNFKGGAALRELNIDIQDIPMLIPKLIKKR